MGCLSSKYQLKCEISEEADKVYGYSIHGWYIYNNAIIQLRSYYPFINPKDFDIPGFGCYKSDLAKVNVNFVYLSGPLIEQQDVITLGLDEGPTLTPYVPPSSKQLKVANKVPRITGTACDVCTGEWHRTWHRGVIQAVQEEVMRVTFGEETRWLPLITNLIAPLGTHTGKVT